MPAPAVHVILCTDYREHDAHAWESVTLGTVHCPGREPANVDVLPRDMYVTARKGIACIRLIPTVDVTMCGRLGREAEFTDKRSPSYVSQHCTACDAAYRAANHGRAAVCH